MEDEEKDDKAKKHFFLPIKLLPISIYIYFCTTYEWIGNICHRITIYTIIYMERIDFKIHIQQNIHIMGASTSHSAYQSIHS